jgi:putative oxidoreductase
VRRPYSSFSHGAPGAGLLLLRLAVAAVLLVDAAALFRPGTPAAFVALGIASLATGLLLLFGLWTPVAATMAAAIAVWNALPGGPALGLHALSGFISVALVLLGPGGWSIDARLFGWKRFEIRSGVPNGDGVSRESGDAPLF